MFIPSLFPIARMWNQSEYLSVNKGHFSTDIYTQRKSIPPETRSPRNDREDSFMMPQKYGYLNKVWTSKTPTDKWTWM